MGHDTPHGAFNQSAKANPIPWLDQQVNKVAKTTRASTQATAKPRTTHQTRVVVNCWGPACRGRALAASSQ
eukprot:4833432-Amphidinium_carterae.1